MSKTNTREEIDFIDIPEGWEITRKIKKSLHHQECSFVQANMYCDCGVIEAASYVKKKYVAFIEKEKKEAYEKGWDDCYQEHVGEK